MACRLQGEKRRNISVPYTSALFRVTGCLTGLTEVCLFINLHVTHSIEIIARCTTMCQDLYDLISKTWTSKLNLIWISLSSASVMKLQSFILSFIYFWESMWFQVAPTACHSPWPCPLALPGGSRGIPRPDGIDNPYSLFLVCPGVSFQLGIPRKPLKRDVSRRHPD